MFKFLDSLSDSYTWPVVSNVAVNSGKVTQLKFAAEFKRLEDERIQDMGDASNEQRPKTDKALLDEVLISVGEEIAGEYAPATEAEQKKLLGTAGVRKAVVLAYYRSLSGEKAKN